MANNGIRVVIAGLDMDFLGQPSPMPYLMATAEYVTKVHAICKKNRKSCRIILWEFSQNQDLVQLGETDSYEAVSRKSFADDVLNKK